MEKDLHRQDIVRDIINKKLPFMSEEFYKAEIKKQKRNAKFRMNFDDLLQAVSDKIRTMKAQGVNPKKEDQAKIAAMQGNGTGWNKKVTSPPKQQNPPAKVKCYNCNASHGMDRCNDLMVLPLEKVVEKMRAERACFNCLKPNPGHIAKFCKDEGFRCAKCGLLHPTILCGLRQLQQQQRQEKTEEARKSAAPSTSGTSGKVGGDKKGEGKGKSLSNGSSSSGDNPTNLNNA